MTTTDIIKLLTDYEYGAISRKPREISLTINGKYMPNPSITLSSTGDGIAGPEIDLDIIGEFMEPYESQEEPENAISRQYDDGHYVKNLLYGLSDADTDKYAVQVQNGEGYYNSDGQYVSYNLD